MLVNKSIDEVSRVGFKNTRRNIRRLCRQIITELTSAAETGRKFAKALRKTNLLGSLANELYSAKYVYTFYFKGYRKECRMMPPGSRGPKSVQV